MALVRLRSGPLRARAGGGDHTLDGATIRELMSALEREQPGVSGWILDERGVIRRHIAVFVNGELGDDETPVGPDDRVEVLQAISGGMR